MQNKYVLHKLRIKDGSVYIDDFKLSGVTSVKRADGNIIGGRDDPAMEVQITLWMESPFDVESNSHYIKVWDNEVV